MVVELPMGSDRARARIPALRLRPLEDAAVARAIALEAIAAHEAAAASERAAAASDPRGRLALAALLAGLERHAEALSVLEELGAQRPDDALIWLEIARARVRVGRPALAAEAARQALAVAETADDRELALELRLLSR